MENQKVCYQYTKKLKEADFALREAGLLKENVDKLRIIDYEFHVVEIDDFESKRRINRFICKHEYLGKPHQRTTHLFYCTYNSHIAGVITFSTPNSFSHILGKKYRDQEKLISRGATSAIGCKNLGSALNSFAIKWMVQNTEFRIFTGYSDPEANELGTIYKSLNFIYLGGNYGAKKLLFDPNKPEKGWFSDRQTRKLSTYKRLAKQNSIEWKRHWNTQWKIHWHMMPPYIADIIKSAEKEYSTSCLKRKPPRKHKWILIKGRNKREHKELIKAFKKQNPKLIQSNGDLGIAYPRESERGQ
jgi:hypothetical protein